MEASKRNEYATVKPCSSFDDWFQKNGRPQHLHEPKYQYVNLQFMFQPGLSMLSSLNMLYAVNVRALTDLCGRLFFSI
jgi:hypothetical protein